MSAEQTLLSVVKGIAKLAADRTIKGKSLVEMTKPARVEPITLVDSRVQQLPYADDLLHMSLNMFAGYYLQAVSLLTQVGNVEVVRILDELSPERSPLTGLRGVLESEDSPSDYFAEVFNNEIPHGYSLENRASSIQKDVDRSIRREPGDDASVGDGSIKELREATNLSVGKMLNVSIKSQGHEATIPVNVRLRSISIRSDNMAHTLSVSVKERSAKERWHKWRSGQIKFFKDLVFAQDLIEEHRKRLVDDDSGYYRAMTDFDRKNQLASIMSQRSSVSTASSIFVMTKETAKALERKMNGSLSRFRDREKLFKESYAMMMLIVDPDWEMVHIFHRSIEQPTEVSIREIQRSNKRGNGADISEILNAFRQSKAPTI